MNDNKLNVSYDQFIKLALENNIECYSKAIQGMSLFLSHANNSYMYNESYLKDYFEDFDKFLRMLKEKYKLVNTLIEKLNDISQKDVLATINETSLEIDNLWQIEYSDEFSWKANIVLSGDFKLIQNSSLYVIYKSDRFGQKHYQYSIKNSEILNEITKVMDENDAK